MLFWKNFMQGGVRGAMVIIIGNGHGDPRSNPGRVSLLFT